MNKDALICVLSFVLTRTKYMKYPTAMEFQTALKLHLQPVIQYSATKWLCPAEVACEAMRLDRLEYYMEIE